VTIVRLPSRMCLPPYSSSASNSPPGPVAGPVYSGRLKAEAQTWRPAVSASREAPQAEKGLLGARLVAVWKKPNSLQDCQIHWRSETRG
jgi:hypothetical protein